MSELRKAMTAEQFKEKFAKQTAGVLLLLSQLKFTQYSGGETSNRDKVFNNFMKMIAAAQDITDSDIRGNQ